MVFGEGLGSGCVCCCWPPRLGEFSPPFVQINSERRQIICQIERAGKELWDSKACEVWFADADPLVRKVWNF